MFRLFGPCLEALPRKLHLCWTPRSVKKQQENGRQQLVFLSVTVWEPGTGGQDVDTRSSRSHFPHDEMDTVLNSKVPQRTVMAKRRAVGNRRRYGIVIWSRLWLWAAAPHGDRESRRLRPWTSSTRHGDSNSNKKVQPNREPTSVQVEKPSASGLARQGCRLEIHAPWTTGACCASARPFGRWCGHLPQEGGREVGRSVLLKFVDSSSTTTREGSWFFVTPLASAVVIGHGGSTSPDKRQVP